MFHKMTVSGLALTLIQHRRWGQDCQSYIQLCYYLSLTWIRYILGRIILHHIRVWIGFQIIWKGKNSCYRVTLTSQSAWLLQALYYDGFESEKKQPRAKKRSRVSNHLYPKYWWMGLWWMKNRRSSVTDQLITINVRIVNRTANKTLSTI